MRKAWNYYYVNILTSLPVYSGSCFQTHWLVISIENQTDLIIGLVLMDDSGSKGLSSLRTVFDINRLAERLTFCQFLASTRATRSWDEGSIFNLSFALTWGPGRSLLWYTTKRLTFQELSSKRSLRNSEAFYHRVQTKTSEVTENSNWPITENTHFVQLLIAYRIKSAASKSTFIFLESSLLFFSTRWMVVSRVF